MSRLNRIFLRTAMAGANLIANLLGVVFAQVVSFRVEQPVPDAFWGDTRVSAADMLFSPLAFALVWLWTQVDSVDLTVIGWVSRIVPLVLLGGLLGDASERLVAGQQRERALEIAAQRQRDATEVNDTLVQGMASAKWSLEAGRHEAGLATLTQTLELGHQLVSRLLRDANMGPNGHRPPPQE